MKTDLKISVKDLNLYYGKRQVLKNINADFSTGTITAVTGPSGNGKSSFLTVFNRLWKNIPGASVDGSVHIRFGKALSDINSSGLSSVALRKKVGMVFQIPNPLPMSIYKNLAFPLKVSRVRDKMVVRQKIETALKQACLWDEVKDRLNEDARVLSGGQQQRLCIARALVNEPEILLLDEPASSLDRKAAEGIDQLIIDLKSNCTLIVVSHYLDQINKTADTVLEMTEGELSVADRIS